MFFTYVVENPQKKWYTGYTSDLKSRLQRHSNGEVYSTMRMGSPWKLIYYEACLDEKDAKKRERFLKSGRGKQYLKSRLKNYLK